MSARPPLTGEARDDLSSSPTSGDAAAELSLREIFQSYAAFVWRTLRYMGVREADLDDVSQEVFLVVHRKLAEFEGRSTVRTWLYGICMRVAKDHKNRAHVRRESPVSEPPLEIQGPQQEEAIARAESRSLLQQLLEELDDAKREVFVLYEIEGLGMNEIAEAVGCPLQTAYSRLHAARKIVAEAAKRVQRRSVS
jgi:RNA polymerase sigma-70 factor (ECF subfamily)